jgi:hypothetical protein
LRFVPADRPVSSLVLAELYDSGDAAFLDLILQHRGSFKPLLGLIEKWKKDPRPWARRLKIQFVFSGQWQGDRRVVFKRLFKQAWADGDHELMGVFLVALDRCIRRKRVKRYAYSAGVIETSEVLRVAPQHEPGFSTPTKHYLRRRAWRYFRRLGFKDAAVYRAAMADALVRYLDDHMRAGENLLDNWGLMHACFGKSPQITFNARHTNLSTTGRLSDMQAAPMFERHWAAAEGFTILLDILLRALSRPVRVWAIQLLKRLHADALPKIDPETLLKLIDHTDVDVASFAAELLSNATTVSSFPMTTWMRLLATRNPTVVATIVEAFRKHVSLERVTTVQAVELAILPAAAVATLGLEILQGRTVRPAERGELARLAQAKSAAMGREIAAFALSRLNVAGAYQVDEVVAFFDSGMRSVRQGAFSALSDQSPADVDPALWAKLFESPYDDVRMEMVNRLKARVTLPGASAESLAWLWQSVLLNVHRGGRAKLSALREISDRVMREPQSATTLLPVLVLAIRSVRAPEARHSLAALVTAIDHLPALEAEVKRALPEMQLDPAGAA